MPGACYDNMYITYLYTLSVVEAKRRERTRRSELGEIMNGKTRILALETADVAGSVALACDGAIIEERALPSEQRSAQSLAPTLRSVIDANGWRASEFDVVAVTIGPGSFTGLRVGVATAKAFAWAVNANIIGVDTLDAIAYEISSRAVFPSAVACASQFVLSVGVDAQRGDSAVRDYYITRDSSGRAERPVRVETRYRVVSNKEWLSRGAQRAETPILFAGPGLRRVKNISALVDVEHVVDAAYWNPSARGVALVAFPRIENRDFDDVWRLAPEYSRLAAAEEKALAREAQARGSAPTTSTPSLELRGE